MHQLAHIAAHAIQRTRLHAARFRHLPQGKGRRARLRAGQSSSREQEHTRACKHGKLAAAQAAAARACPAAAVHEPRTSAVSATLEDSARAHLHEEYKALVVMSLVGLAVDNLIQGCRHRKQRRTLQHRLANQPSRQCA